MWIELTESAVLPTRQFNYYPTCMAFIHVLYSLSLSNGFFPIISLIIYEGEIFVIEGIWLV